MLRHIGLVSLTRRVSLGELSQVSAAIQKQVVRDFGPIWGVEATVDSFATLADVPIGYWRLVVEEIAGAPSLSGVHGDVDQQPYARVAYSNIWSLVASHEALEMLADPFRNWLIPGPSVSGPERRVSYLVEVCDPCQDPRFGYLVNAVLVSDFVTPQYFEPSTADGVRYTFGGNIRGPRHVREGGYLAWQEPEDQSWWQLVVDSAGNPSTQQLRLRGSAGLSLREKVDRASKPRPWTTLGLSDDDPVLERVRLAVRAARRSARARAISLNRLLQTGTSRQERGAKHKRRKS